MDPSAPERRWIDAAPLLVCLPLLLGQSCLAPGNAGAHHAPITGVQTNHAPLADAGDDWRVLSGGAVTLVGDASHDPDGDWMDFTWRQISGAAVDLVYATAVRATFIAPATTTGQTLIFKLTVTDPEGLTSADTVAVVVVPLDPDTSSSGREDACPDNPAKTQPGVCGCGVPDLDADGDGLVDCQDPCPDSADNNCSDGCPDDPQKTAAGVCGCGIEDADRDHDGTPDCHDACPDDPLKTAPGGCGCGAADSDSDRDGTPDCIDACPADPLKNAPGSCGCGQADTPGCDAPPASLVLDLGEGVTLELAWIPPGTFLMGDAASLDPWISAVSRPAHQVTIARPFYLGVTEVTQRQWQAIMSDRPSYYTGTLNLPVDQVSWDDCQEFCRLLSARTGRVVTLPTESQWEYACRAGTTGLYYFGDDPAALGQHGWSWHNSPSGTEPVGQLPANPFGLHDMYGNVWEWCQDVWHENYDGAPADGSAWLTDGDSALRAARGGSWGHEAIDCSSPSRDRGTAVERSWLIGLRVAVEP